MKEQADWPRPQNDFAMLTKEADARADIAFRVQWCADEAKGIAN
jgi:hypothetical protein